MAIKVTNMEIEVNEKGEAFLIIKSLGSGWACSHIALPIIKGLPESIVKDQEKKAKAREEARKRMEAEKAAQKELSRVAQKAAEDFDKKKGNAVSKAVADARKKMGL